VLETLGGETLARSIASRRRRFPAQELGVLGAQLASAVGYLHRHGVLHLDIKPSNIVVEQGLARLIDLSIARPPGRVRHVRGSRPYMSPEQARGDRVGEPADVWGLGAVLFEAATGRRPFPGARRGRYPQLERRAEAVRRFRRLPKQLAETIDAALEPAPESRPSLAELTAAFAQLAEE